MMLAMYSFLAQLPEKTLIDKQKSIVNKFSRFQSTIYFVSDGYATKVGKATDVFARIRDLQIGNPRRLILLGFNESNKRDINNDESYLHRELSDRHMRGEWFFLTEDDLYKNAEIVIADYFCSGFKQEWVYMTDYVVYKNINDRIDNNYAKRPYFKENPVHCLTSCKNKTKPMPIAVKVRKINYCTKNTCEKDIICRIDARKAIVDNRVLVGNDECVITDVLISSEISSYELGGFECAVAID